MNYRVKTPWVFKKLVYRKLIWDLPNEAENVIYLSFDDGPHPTATPYILEQLKLYNAKASFFCIGKNVEKHPEIYNEILKQGHAIGNHTYNHMNGWKHSTQDYTDDIKRAEELINSNLFRPPYGRITHTQINTLLPKYRIVMWDVLSGDFDINITPEECYNNVVNNIQPGSIVVFHDSEKAWDRMSYTLPRLLQYCANKSWQLKVIT